MAAGMIVLIFGLLFSKGILELLNTKEELLDGAVLYIRIYFLGMPAMALYNFGNGKVSTIPIVGLILIIMTLVFVYITTSTKYGKKVYAVGSNMKGAQMAGINTAVVKISVFVIAGALVGIGAFLWIAMNASADPATTGNSYEMYAIAAAVLGGISMSGGKGKCLGILFGAMSYTIIDKIIVSLKMDSLINNAIKGIILLIVIMVQIVGPQIKQKFKKTE